ASWSSGAVVIAVKANIKLYAAPEVIEGTVAPAERNAEAHGALDIFPRGGHRLFHRRALRQARPDRGGEPAAGAVRVASLDARTDPLMQHAAFEQDVDHFGTRQVAALDHHRSRLQHGDPPRRFAHVVD